MFMCCCLLLLSAAGCLLRRGGEDGYNALNGAPVMGPGQMAQCNGTRTPLSAAAAINLSWPRHRR